MFQSFRQSIKRTANTIQIRSQLPNTAIWDLFFLPSSSENPDTCDDPILLRLTLRFQARIPGRPVAQPGLAVGDASPDANAGGPSSMAAGCP